VDDAKDSGIRADSEREGNDRNRRECGILDQLPQRKSEITHNYSPISLITKRDHWIDPGGASRRNETGSGCDRGQQRRDRKIDGRRSEEHTSELQSRSDLVCRLLLEKKK